MYQCSSQERTTTFLNYDTCLRASSAPFLKKRPATPGKRQGTLQSAHSAETPICCQARTERIKLHSGYYPANTPLYIRKCALGETRCLILLGEKVPQRPASRYNGVNTKATLLKFDDDDSKSVKWNVGVSTDTDDVTMEAFCPPSAEEKNDSAVAKKQSLLELAMAAIMSTPGSPMLRPAVDMEPLWHTRSQKALSEGRSKVAIDFSDDGVIMDKDKVLPHMGVSVHSMSKELKDLLTCPEEYRFLSRFVQVLHTEKKTRQTEQESHYDLPLGDHLEERCEGDELSTPRPSKSAHARPKTPTDRKSQRPKQSAHAKLQPSRPMSSKYCRKISKPVEALARTESPVFVWRSPQQQRTAAEAVKDNEADRSGFKTVMCG